MSRRAIVIVALAAASCTTERVVLGGGDDGIIRSCDEAWALGATGVPCDFDGSCVRDSPADPMCCTQFAYCRVDELVIDLTCNPDCAPCADDTSCAYGAAICEGNACEPCPIDPDGMLNCAPCPFGWDYLTRNGCLTCECAPASECALPGESCDPNLMEICYPGRHRVDGCAPTDPGCAANVCSRTGCGDPGGGLDTAPLGCFMPCSGLPNCQQCASTACECEGGQWLCQPVCIDQTPVSLPCAI